MTSGRGFPVASSAGTTKQRKLNVRCSYRWYLAAVGLVFLALPGQSQPAHALDGLSIADIKDAFGASDQPPAITKTSLQGDDAFSALRDFAQQLGPNEPKAAPASERVGLDAEYSALRDFAKGLGDDLPGARNIRGVKVAEADDLLSALRGVLSNSRADEAKKPSNSVTPAPIDPAAARAQAVKRNRDAADATYVGTKTCLTCHAGQAATFGETLMGRIGKTQKGKFECENCHGPGSAHAKAGGGRGVGGIISFRKDDLSRTPAENNTICLGCHEKGDRTYWSGSTHEQRDVACTNCHTVMQKVSVKFNLKTAFEPETCFQCHKDRRAQMFRSSHMPVREGKMVCSDCHNPHGSATEALLRENSINDNCYKCHAEKRGPFLFEHAPVRENCTNCHDPHGSINEAMLKVSRPRLCGECHGIGHGLTSGINAVQTFGRACQNCHTMVHGTNSPSGALLHR
jgi:DmsE family decaheme c-type cytochrome